MPPDPAKGSRLFIGCFFSSTLQHIVTHLQQTLKSLTVDWKISWTPPVNSHLTLKFLGAVSAQQQTLLETWLETQPKPATFELHFGQYGAFPNWHDPQVVYLQIIEHTGQLKQWAAHLNHALEALGFQREARSYHPHLTLGRVRKKGRPFVVPTVSELSPEMIADFALIKSELLPTGSCYTVLKKYPLGV